MTCLNGFFHDLYTESLAEALMRAEQGGAVAVWTSSGLTFPDQQHLINQELIRQLLSSEKITIGQAAARAKAATSDQGCPKDVDPLRRSSHETEVLRNGMME